MNCSTKNCVPLYTLAFFPIVIFLLTIYCYRKLLFARNKPFNYLKYPK